MEIVLGVISILVAGGLLIALVELRVRQPDVLVLYEAEGRIGIRKGPLYPRHFSLPLKRTTSPIELVIEAAARGNLILRIKVIGSAAPSVEHIQSLVRVGGWDDETVVRAVEQVKILLQGWIKEYTESAEIHAISSPAILNHLNQKSGLIEERFGIELIALAIESLEPIDPDVTDALSQQEQARLFEQTEKLNQQARITAARARNQADEAIAEMEHGLELRRTELKKIQFQQDAQLARQRIEDELARSRLRLSFQKEELDVLRRSPELLMLTPQAAQLAEASQSLKSARTVISLSPPETTNGSSLFALFREFLERESEPQEDAS